MLYNFNILKNNVYIYFIFIYFNCRFVDRNKLFMCFETLGGLSKCVTQFILNSLFMKRLIVLGLLLTNVLSASAQSSFSIGPKVGLNMSNYTGGNIKSDALFSYHVGGLMSFGLGNTFFVQPEILFSSQGAKIDNQGSKENYKVSYLAVPIMLKLRTGSGLYFEAGPQVSFKTGEDVKDETIDKFSKNLDLSLGAGLGYQSAGGFGIGARYMAGISKVGNFDAHNINPDFKNSLLQVSLFYAIPFAK